MTQEREISINNDALIIGGGVAGLNAAINLGNQGSIVYIIEKTDKLGGLARKIKFIIDGYNVDEYLSGLIDKIKNHPRIEVILNSTVGSVEGFVGNFISTIKSINKENKKIEHGVVIVTTGANEYKPKEYLFKKKML